MVGGRAPAAHRRVARFGDGWLAAFASPRRVSEGIQRIGEIALAEGRDPVPFRHSLLVWCGFGDSEQAGREAIAPRMEALYDRPFTDFERYVPCGPPESVAAQLQPYVAAGIRCFEIIPSAEDPIAGLEAVRRVREALVATRGDA